MCKKTLSATNTTVECFALQGGLYALVAAGMDEDVVEHPVFTGLAVELKELWYGRKK